MTNQEFWRELTKLLASSSTCGRIPALIKRARSEHLSIPMVLTPDGRSKSGRKTSKPVVILGDGMRFARFATSMAAPSVLSTTQLPSGQFVGEAPIDGLFEELQDCGYDGIAFITPEGLIGFEWDELGL